MTSHYILEDKFITVAVPGTCGELVQGWHTGWEQAVLISCPIARYSRVSVRLRADSHISTPGSGPGGYAKLRRAARLVLDDLGYPNLGADVRVSSQLLPGRGMASSTADIVGVMAGLGLALGRPLSPGKLAHKACRVEPSDSTMFAGLALLAYRDKGQCQVIGSPSPLPLLMLDPGQVVETLTFNGRLDLAALQKLASATQTAIEMLRRGVVDDDPAAIGAAATLSAQSFQTIHDNPLLPQAQQWALATGALGVVRAHSGSVVGLLYASETHLSEPAKWLASRFSGVMTQTHLTSGGYFTIGDSSQKGLASPKSGPFASFDTTRITC